MRKFILIIYILFLASLSFASETRFVQIRFTENVQVKGMGNPLQYSDCLYYPIDKVPEQSEIDKVKADRVANWKAIVENPVVQPEPTKAQLEEEKANLTAQLTDLQTRIDAKNISN